MNCPVCNQPRSGNICPVCKMTTGTLRKIRATSRWFLAQGLRKTMGGDYDSALEDLRKALRYDKKNTEARNIIGLIYFHRGEVVESVREWTLSLYCQKEGNRAAMYLQELQKNPRQYDALCDSLTLYNEAVDQARKGDMEFAIVRLRKAVNLNRSFVRAYLLMALCYIQTNSLKKAQSALEKAERIEPMRIEPERYRDFIREKQDAGEADTGQDIQDFSRNFYVQQNMYQPDMQEISGGKRDRKISMKNWSGPIMQMVLFFLGVLCCLGFMMTLYVPAKTSQYRQEARQREEELAGTADRTKELEEDLARKQQEIQEYKQQAAQHQKEMENLKNQYESNAAGSQEELLWQAANEYYTEKFTDSGNTLYRIQQEKLTGNAAAFYEELFSLIQAKVVSTYSNEAYSQYAAAVALEGEAQTKALEAALTEVEKARYFARGTNWEAWQLYYQASIYQILGRRTEALETLDQFFEVYRGSTDEELYGWASNLQRVLSSRAGQ